MLLICETHPVPYHAPVYRALARDHDVPLKVLYGSDFSVRGYYDQEFRSQIAWDVDLMKGYEASFIHTTQEGIGKDYNSVSPRGLSAAVAAARPSMIAALGYYHPFDRAVIRAAIRERIPLIFRGETNDTTHYRFPPYRLVRDILLRYLYKKCERLLYVGQHSREHYLRLGCSEEKLIFSPYCVASEEFLTSEEDRMQLRAQARRELNIADDAKVVLFSGKLSLRKGVDLLPGAIRALPETLRKDCVLLIMGEGRLHEDLERRCQESGTPVRFTGFRNQSQLSPFYHAADILALPSRVSETWGVVVNEALLHGVPCVVSDKVGCQPDLVIPEVTGEVCVAGDVDSLKMALAKVLSRPFAEADRESCRDMARQYSVGMAALGLAKAWAALK